MKTPLPLQTSLSDSATSLMATNHRRRSSSLNDSSQIEKNAAPTASQQKPTPKSTWAEFQKANREATCTFFAWAAAVFNCGYHWLLGLFGFPQQSNDHSNLPTRSLNVDQKTIAHSKKSTSLPSNFSSSTRLPWFEKTWDAVVDYCQKEVENIIIDPIVFKTVNWHNSNTTHFEKNSIANVLSAIHIADKTQINCQGKKKGDQVFGLDFSFSSPIKFDLKCCEAQKYTKNSFWSTAYLLGKSFYDKKSIFSLALIGVTAEINKEKQAITIALKTDTQNFESARLHGYTATFPLIFKHKPREISDMFKIIITCLESITPLTDVRSIDENFSPQARINLVRSPKTVSILIGLYHHSGSIMPEIGLSPAPNIESLILMIFKLLQIYQWLPRPSIAIVSTKNLAQ